MSHGADAAAGSDGVQPAAESHFDWTDIWSTFVCPAITAAPDSASGKHLPELVIEGGSKPAGKITVAELSARTDKLTAPVVDDIAAKAKALTVADQMILINRVLEKLKQDSNCTAQEKVCAAALCTQLAKSLAPGQIKDLGQSLYGADKPLSDAVGRALFAVLRESSNSSSRDAAYQCLSQHGVSASADRDKLAVEGYRKGIRSTDQPSQAAVYEAQVQHAGIKLQRLGLAGSDEEIRRMAETAIKKYGEAGLHKIIAQAQMFNALPEACRQQIAGQVKPLNLAAVAEQLGKGSLQETNHAFLAGDLSAKVTQLKNRFADMAKAAEGKSKDLGKELVEKVKTLAEITGKGISSEAWFHHNLQKMGLTVAGLDKVIAPMCADPKLELTQQQKDLIKEIKALEEKIRKSDSAAAMAKSCVGSIEIAADIGKYASQRLAENRFDSDRTALSLWSRCGDGLKQLAPQIWQELQPGTDGSRTSFDRLKAAGLISGDKLPDVGSQVASGDRFNEGIKLLTRLPQLAAGAERTGAANQGWAALSADPVMSKFFEDQADLLKTLGELEALYKPAGEGFKSDNLSFDLRTKACTLSAAIKRLSEPEVLKAMEERLAQLEKLKNESTDSETKQRAELLIGSIRQTLALVDPNQRTEENGAKVDHLRHMIDVIKSPKFSADGDENAILKTVLIVGAGLAAAVATGIALVSWGAASPLAATAWASFAGMVGSELASEGLYRAGVVTPEERTLLARCVAGQKEYNEKTGKMEDISGWRVAGNYSLSLGLQTLVGYGALKLAPHVAQKFSSLFSRVTGAGAEATASVEAQAAVQALSRNLSRLEAAAAGGTETQKSFVRRFLTDFSNGAFDTAAQEMAEHGLDKAVRQVAGEHSLVAQLLTSFLAVTAVSSRAHIQLKPVNGRHYKLEAGDGKALSVEDVSAIKKQFENDGFKVKHEGNKLELSLGETKIVLEGGPGSGGKPEAEAVLKSREDAKAKGLDVLQKNMATQFESFLKQNPEIGEQAKSKWYHHEKVRTELLEAAQIKDDTARKAAYANARKTIAELFPTIKIDNTPDEHLATKFKGVEQPLIDVIQNFNGDLNASSNGATLSTLVKGLEFLQSKNILSVKELAQFKKAAENYLALIGGDKWQSREVLGRMKSEGTADPATLGERLYKHISEASKNGKANNDSEGPKAIMKELKDRKSLENLLGLSPETAAKAWAQVDAIVENNSKWRPQVELGENGRKAASQADAFAILDSAGLPKEQNAAAKEFFKGKDVTSYNVVKLENGDLCVSFTVKPDGTRPEASVKGFMAVIGKDGTNKTGRMHLLWADTSMGKSNSPANPAVEPVQIKVEDPNPKPNEDPKKLMVWDKQETTPDIDLSARLKDAGFESVDAFRKFLANMVPKAFKAA